MSKQQFCPICKLNVPINTYSGHFLDKHLQALMSTIKGENK